MFSGFLLHLFLTDTEVKGSSYDCKQNKNFSFFLDESFDTSCWHDHASRAVDGALVKLGTLDYAISDDRDW